MKKTKGLIGMLLIAACICAIPSPQKSTGATDQMLGADNGKQMDMVAYQLPAYEYTASQQPTNLNHEIYFIKPGYFPVNSNLHYWIWLAHC